MALGHRENPYQLAYVQHKRSAEPVPAYPYLLGAVRHARGLAIPDGALHNLFPDRNTFSPEQLTIEQLSRYTPQDLIRLISPKLKPLYQIAQASLDESMLGISEGFNDHTLEGHILGVTNDGLGLLDAAQATSHQKNIFTLSSLPHDAGNAWSRDGHEVVSFDVLCAFIPTITNDAQIARELKQTIFYHRESTGWKAMLQIAAGTSRNEDFYRLLRETVGIPALALNIADSSDIGPHRANRYRGNSEIVDDDYQMVELLSRKRKSAYDPNSREFHFNFAFSSRPCEEIEELGYLSMQSKKQRHGQAKTIVSPDMQTAFKEKGKLYSTTWLEMFQKIHGVRQLVVAAFSFALFPEQQEFICRLEDEEILPLHTSGKYQSKLPYEQHFTRDSLFQHLKTLTGSETR